MIGKPNTDYGYTRIAGIAVIANIARNLNRRNQAEVTNSHPMVQERLLDTPDSRADESARPLYGRRDDEPGAN